MAESHNETKRPQCIESTGPWPFITHRVIRELDETLWDWESRHHRKRLVRREFARVVAISRFLLHSLWMPRKLNWWIGVVFALGSSLFALASLMILFPDLFTRTFDSIEINAIYFAGSIPFTTAAYLQLFQAANADPIPGEEIPDETSRKLIGWKPGEVGWLSCFLQFVGTILFNFNTFDGMIHSLNWFEKDLLIWIPNILGSVLFLSSGYLAFIEACHAYWRWNFHDISWWVVFINLLGCVGFMISALLSLQLPNEAAPIMAMMAVGFTFQGAIGFFVGSLLMLPEAAYEKDKN